MMAMVNDPTQVTLTHVGPVFSVERLEWVSSRGLIVKDIVRHPGAVTIIGELRDGRLVMIRNHRVAVGAKLLEFCAGKRETGEDPQQGALRELEEETGFSAGAIEPIGRFYTTPGFADELMHVFRAWELTPIERRLEPGEEIEVVLLEPDQVRSAIADGTLVDGKSIAAFHLWESSRARSPEERG
jgi:ADP-ribose pyrophosphatase